MTKSAATLLLYIELLLKYLAALGYIVLIEL
jgi:hypothetical protein